METRKLRLAPEGRCNSTEQYAECDPAQYKIGWYTVCAADGCMRRHRIVGYWEEEDEAPVPPKKPAPAEEEEGEPLVRSFSTGATRDLDTNKLDFEGFYAPTVMVRFAEYMHKNRQTAAGVRDSDNWQKGIPKEAYMKSGYRHFMDWWMLHRNLPSLSGADMEESLCALLFNVQGYLFEHLKEQDATTQ